MDRKTRYAVIAAHRQLGARELAYTATLADAFWSTSPENWKWSSTTAEFLEKPHLWFSGKGALSRARQFANLLIADAKEHGFTILPKTFFIEIDPKEYGIHILSRRGTRIQFVYQLRPQPSSYHVV